MKTIISNIDAPLRWKSPCVLALGMFDGLHLGHRRVLARAAEIAARNGASPCVLTFSPHPSTIISMGRPPVKMIFDSAVRARMFEAAGAKKVFVKNFDKAFADFTPQDFEEFLKQKFPQIRGIVTGANFVFGKGASGNPRTLADMAKRNGWEYAAVDGYSLEGARVSSTRLRDALQAGDMELYARLAGSPYCAEGVSRAGKHFGRKIGFPTINLPWRQECVPPYGVYAVELECGGVKYRGVANYGTSPTVGETEPLLETFLFAEDVPFGARRRICVKLLKFMRAQKKFDGIEALKAQIAADVENVKKYFAGK